MRFALYSPPPDLAPWVECAWLLEGKLPEQGQVILPDGRLELIFHLGDPPVLADGLRQLPVLLAGRMLGPLELWPAGTMRALGVRWRPGAIPSEDPSLSAWARQTREHLGNAADPLAALWPALRGLLPAKADEAVVASVRAIEAAGGCGPLDGFLPGGLSIRQWQRRFARTTGFSPKAFARIVRFQHLIALHQAGRRRRWAELALAAGFYDQAHLANEFRAFSGQSPEAFFRAGRGMAEFYLHRDAFLQDEPAPERLDSRA